MYMVHVNSSVQCCTAFIHFTLQLRLRKDDDAQRALFKTFHVLKHLCDFEGVSKENLSEYYVHELFTIERDTLNIYNNGNDSVNLTTYD